MATRWSSHRPACSIPYRSPHVSSLAKDSLTNWQSLLVPAHVALTIYTFGTVDRTACRGFFFREEVRIWSQSRGLESLCLPICTTTSMLCSWGIAEAKRCMPAPRRLHWMASDVIDAEFALRRCQCVHLSSIERVFFCFCTNFCVKNVAIDSKCIENHGGTLHSCKWSSFQDCQGIFLVVARKDSPRPGVGFSNFETNYLVFSSTSTTKRLRRWSFWYEKWFCLLKNLSRVLPSLRSNGKVRFDGDSGARD